jgi:hypothetical protein
MSVAFSTIGLVQSHAPQPQIIGPSFHPPFSLTIKVLDEEAKCRFILVDLVLDIEKFALIYKKCKYILAFAGSQITIYLLRKYQIVLKFRNGLIKLIRPFELLDLVKFFLYSNKSQSYLYLKIYNLINISIIIVIIELLILN